MKALIARKLGMTSIMDQAGRLIPLTVLEVKPNFVSQVKTKEKDGYEAVQIATEAGRPAKKPQADHFKKAKIKPACSFSRELRLKEAGDWQAGQQIPLADFAAGDPVEVTAKSKGKGFAGTIKRYNFSRQPQSHGHKGNTRQLGSIGAVGPHKVFKGKKMPGRLGNRQVTVKGLSVGLVDGRRQLIGIRGAVPGPRRGLVFIRKRS